MHLCSIKLGNGEAFKGSMLNPLEQAKDERPCD
jgi:hypothetical protein